MSDQQVPTEIRGFSSPSEYERLCAFLARLIDSKVLIETSIDPNYGPGEVYGGRWFEDSATHEVWRLIPPDYPFKGVWEPVNLLRSGTVAP